MTAGDAVPLTADVLRTWPLPSDPAADKHARGTVLVIAGTVRTPGAALLAGTAALRAGAGRLQLATVRSSAAALGAAVPEALVVGLAASPDGSPDPTEATQLLREQAATADALVIGPGLEDLSATAGILSGLLPLVGDRAVIVLDAMAVAAFPSLDDRARASASGRIVFTPNPAEATTLAPEASGDLAPADLAAHAARAHSAAVTIAGRVASPDGRGWVARGAVAGLGTSGSGDVLAGLVGEVAARCGDAVQAACWGTYLHVEAGVRLGDRVGRVGYLARELLDEVPRALDDAAPSA